MDKTAYHVIGVMSGTSLDGIDLCYVRFEKNEVWNYVILITDTVDYTKDWRISLKQAIDLSNLELEALDRKFTVFLSSTIRKAPQFNSQQQS